MNTTTQSVKLRIPWDAAFNTVRLVDWSAGCGWSRLSCEFRPSRGAELAMFYDSANRDKRPGDEIAILCGPGDRWRCVGIKRAVPLPCVSLEIEGRVSHAPFTVRRRARHAGA